MRATPPTSGRFAASAAAAAAVAAFIAELLSPRSVAVHMFYVLPILLTWFIPSRASTLAAAAAATALTVAGFLRAGGDRSGTAITDHAIAVTLFVAVTAVILQAKRQRAQRVEAMEALVRSEERRRQNEALLERRVEERTAELQQQAILLRRLASDLTLAEQRARQSLARTLHDGVQQLLFGARLQIDRLSRGGASEVASTQAALERVRANLDEAITATRALSVDLSPPVLRETGLAAALEWLAEWMLSRHGLTVRLSLDWDANPDREDVRDLVFESVRELWFNVVKHAGVTDAALELAVDGPANFRVTVADAGRGVNVSLLNQRLNAAGTGFGLFAIRERLTLLGGHLRIESEPGHGMRCTLVAPRGGTAAASTRGPTAATDGSPPSVHRPAPDAPAGHRIEVV